MSTLYPLPKDSLLRPILVMLFGGDVTVEPADAVAPETGKSMVAVYINDEDQPVSAGICDYDFAAFAGSSLTMIPLGGAEDAAKTGDFSEMMLANVQEVMNICSRLLMDSNSPHLRLDAVYPTLEAVPDAAQEMLKSCGGQAGFEVLIPKYGNGRLSFTST